ncbi:MAG: DUF3883 domain-containing protein [Gemmataceae bacterium]
MSDPTARHEDWSEAEIDGIVGAYFDMLRKDLVQEPYNKAEYNRQVRERIARSRGSVEFKLANVSAVLERLGLPIIRGYRPRENFQRALIAGVDRYLTADPSILATGMPVMRGGLAQPASLIYEAPPQARQNEAPPAGLARLVAKFDPAARDAQNRALGRAGEEKVLETEWSNLRLGGREDLARKVRWVSEEDGDGAGYDILSFDPTGRERLLEVKTTNGSSRVPFFLTENERIVSLERADSYRIVRVYRFLQEPRAFELPAPIAHHVTLNPAVWRARFDNVG